MEQDCYSGDIGWFRYAVALMILPGIAFSVGCPRFNRCSRGDFSPTMGGSWVEPDPADNAEVCDRTAPSSSGACPRFVKMRTWTVLTSHTNSSRRRSTLWCTELLQNHGQLLVGAVRSGSKSLLVVIGVFDSPSARIHRLDKPVLQYRLLAQDQSEESVT